MATIENTIDRILAADPDQSEPGGGESTQEILAAAAADAQTKADAARVAAVSAAATYTQAQAGLAATNAAAYADGKVSAEEARAIADATAKADAAKAASIAAAAADATAKDVAIKAVADAAKAAADAAKARIDSISANGILDRSEKPVVNSDWLAINKKATLLEIQADGMGVSRTTLSQKFVELYNYLHGLTPAWNDATQDTPIVRADFDAKFNNYYEAELALINAIATKTATMAQWPGVSGPGKPADSATVGATWGVNIDGANKPADNATVGAPAGTKVGNTDAAVVESNANNAVKPPSFTLTGTFGGTTSNPSTSMQTLSKALSATVTGNANPVTLTWEATNVDATVPIRMTANTGTAVTVSASAANVGILIAIKCTATDDVTGVSLVRIGLVNLRFGNV